jgi:acyl-CoA synthetase (AMP-forming)/AMP-acid ligase II
MTTFDDLAACTAALPDVQLTSNDLAQIVYTSGTESLPKGAMLTHDAVMWQYVSCVVEAEIAEATTWLLHALPLYHCAQLDVFFGPGVYVGSTNVITGQAGARQPAAADGEAPHHQFFAPPTSGSRCCAHRCSTADLSSLAKGYYGASIMPVEVLRELAGACRHAPVEPLRPDRDRAAGHRAGPGRSAAQAGLGRPRRSERRDPRGRRRDARRAARRESARSCTARRT